MATRRKRRRKSGADVDPWKPRFSIPMVIENSTGTPASIAIFVRNETSLTTEDEHIAWKVFNMSSPGSANLIYPQNSAVGVICKDLGSDQQPKPNGGAAGRSRIVANANPARLTAQEVGAMKKGTTANGEKHSEDGSGKDSSGGRAKATGTSGSKQGGDHHKELEVGKPQMAGPKECKPGSTWMFLPPNTRRLKCELNHVEDAVSTPKGSVLIINKYSFRDLEVVFGLFKLGSMLLAQRNVPRGQFTYFAENSNMYFAISKEPKVKVGEFIEDFSIFDECWNVDLKDFPNGIKVSFVLDGITGKTTIITQQKY